MLMINGGLQGLLVITGRGRTLHVAASRTGRTSAATSACSRPLRRISRSGGCCAAFATARQLIVPAADGDACRHHDGTTGSTRLPPAAVAGVTDRSASVSAHGFVVSLLQWERRSLDYVAEQAGHSIATLAG